MLKNGLGNLWIVLVFLCRGVMGVEAVVSREGLKLVQDAVKGHRELSLQSVVLIHFHEKIGSGVLLENHLIATAAHVMGEPGFVHEVELGDGVVVKAEALGRNEQSDVGLLWVVEEDRVKVKVDPVVVRALRVPPRLGEWVFSLGHAGGGDGRRGPLLRVGRIVRVAADTIQTDCVLMEGDSGGPVFDLQGRVIAINSRVADAKDQNFHATAGALLRDWSGLMADVVLDAGSVVPWTGVKWDNHQAGLVVEELADGGPASKAGLEVGDTLLGIDGESVLDYDAFSELMRLRLVGEKMSWRILRNGKGLVVEVIGGVR